MEVIPLFNSNRRSLEMDRVRKPSKETLRVVRAEIRVSGDKREYVPGDTIVGEFVLFKTKAKATVKDVYFNAVELRFENKVKNGLGMEGSYFSMDCDPPVESLPRFALKPDKHEFEECSFPFQFTIPREHLEDTCEERHEMHRSLLPSFGLPQLAGVSFGASEVAGLKPTRSKAMDKLERLVWNRFCNYYAITCRVKQIIKGQDKPYVVFSRSMEIRVDSPFKPVPTNLTHSDSRVPEVGSYYSCNANDNGDLLVVQSIQLKDDSHTPLGSITASSLIPPPLESHGPPAHFPLTLKYRPTTANSAHFPTVAITTELVQYVTMSQNCIPPHHQPTLPTISEYATCPGKNCIVTQRVQTVFTSKDQHTADWVPDYEDHSSYISTLELSIPTLEKDQVLTSTFHSCFLQNAYYLHTTVEFDSKDGVEVKKGFWRRKSDPKVLVKRNTAELRIPVTVV